MHIKRAPNSRALELDNEVDMIYVTRELSRETLQCSAAVSLGAGDKRTTQGADAAMRTSTEEISEFVSPCRQSASCTIPELLIGMPHSVELIADTATDAVTARPTRSPVDRSSRPVCQYIQTTERELAPLKSLVSNMKQ